MRIRDRIGSMQQWRFFAMLGYVTLLAACAHEGAMRPGAITAPLLPAPTSADDRPCMQTSHGCIALNPDVTGDTIARTICVSGYTKSVRPGTSFTNGVKAKLIREAGIEPSHMGDYELDHLVPLAVGGHPRKLSNLMLQPWYGENSAAEKDKLEVRLQHLVCTHRINLEAAQHCIAENWKSCESAIASAKPLPAGRVVR